MTNEEIWDNLYDRFMYATTGAGILVSFKADGHEMGQVVTKESGSEVEFDVSVLGTDDFKAEVLCNNEVLITKESADRACDFTFTKEAGSAEDCYYVRITQKDDHQAWSSPIWIKGGEK